jgi:hypothetical protein
MLMRIDLPPHADGPPTHYHFAFEEVFEVLAGELTINVGGKDRVLHAGDKVKVPVKVIHKYKNTTDQAVSFHVLLTPPHFFEESMRIWYGMMPYVPTNKQGLPKNIFQLAILLKMQDSILAGVPVWIQKVMIGGLVLIGKWMGADKTFAQYLPDRLKG